jgi:hypothetical protein
VEWALINHPDQPSHDARKADRPLLPHSGPVFDAAGMRLRKVPFTVSNFLVAARRCRAASTPRRCFA